MTSLESVSLEYIFEYFCLSKAAWVLSNQLALMGSFTFCSPDSCESCDNLVVNLPSQQREWEFYWHPKFGKITWGQKKNPLEIVHGDEETVDCVGFLRVLGNREELCRNAPLHYEVVQCSVFLLIHSSACIYSPSPDRSMGSVCADTTQQGTTVRGVHHYTMTSFGSQEMEKLVHQMNAEVSGREFNDPRSQDNKSLSK